MCDVCVRRVLQEVLWTEVNVDQPEKDASIEEQRKTARALGLDA